MNAQYQCLELENVNDKISRIIFKRADKHHALNLQLMDELCRVFETLENSTCSVVLLEAEGKTFCSGLDLEQATDDTLIEKMAHQLAKLLTILHKTQLVTIAVVQGHAIAGGGGLAASCDLVLMAKEAKIGFPETHRGLIAAQVAVILMRQLTSRYVQELLLTGELVTSQRAYEIGLVNKVVDLDKIKEEALHLAEQVLKGAPTALKHTKHLLKQLQPGDFSKDLELAVSFHHQARVSMEGKEGITAFLEKRLPSWSIVKH